MEVSSRLLGRRSTVGQQTLTLLIGVRIPTSQPHKNTFFQSGAAQGGFGLEIQARRTSRGFGSRVVRVLTPSHLICAPSVVGRFRLADGLYFPGDGGGVSVFHTSCAIFQLPFACRRRMWIPLIFSVMAAPPTFGV